MRTWLEFIQEAMSMGDGPEQGTITYLQTYFPGFLRMANEIADKAIADAEQYLKIESDDLPLTPVEILVQVIASKS